MKDALDLAKIRSLYEALNPKSDFHEKTGISRSVFRYIMIGQTSPTASTIQKIASYFKVSCGYLFSDYEEFRHKDNYKQSYQKSLVIKDAVIFFNE